MKGKHIGLLAILVIFSFAIVGIGNAALAFDKPASGAIVAGVQTLNATKAIGDEPINSTNLTFWYKPITSTSYTVIKSVKNSSVDGWTVDHTTPATNITWNTAGVADGNYTLKATFAEASDPAAINVSVTRQIYINNTETTFSTPIPASNSEQKDNTSVTGFSITTSEYCGPGATTLYFDGAAHTMTNTSDARTTFQYTTAITDLADGQHSWFVSSACTGETVTSGTYLITIDRKGKGYTCDDGSIAISADECGKTTTVSSGQPKSWFEENWIAVTAVVLLAGLYLYNKKK